MPADVGSGIEPPARRLNKRAGMAVMRGTHDP